MVVGVCRLSLYLPACQSLKDKRQHLRKLTDRLRTKFNAAVAEVDAQDSWQRGVIAVTLVGNEGKHVQSMIDTLTHFAEETLLAQIVDRDVELLHYNDGQRLTEHALRRRR